MELKNISPEELPDISRQSGFETLEITERDVSSFHKLARHKTKDPFDRLIIWQAINNGLTLISKDRGLYDYKESGLKVIW